MTPPPAARVVPVRQRRGDAVRETADWVAEEVPVALEYNGLSHAVMLASPADLEDFALGFSLTEGIIDAPSDVRDIALVQADGGIAVRLDIASGCFARLKDRRRSLTGRTGCGLCGAESLAQAVRPPAVVRQGLPFDADVVRAALASLRARQPLHDASGAAHAAGFASAAGELLLVREDVGRHNALDKLVGALAQAGVDAGAGFVVVTSRASYEMVGKAAWTGSGLLAAVSGVTALAIDHAQAAGLCLVGFARGENLNLYTHPQRVRSPDPV
ncbi:MAG: formate dehydrogenase accessory sulfurtransferase FdhD [Comamonadaceae bacterium]|nr:MAG: formate dehydrogenase accessory sulfurtransferase FdhD [Comamonadaceae bacterium]